MNIREITKNKKQYLDLLLLADEQEDMVDRYLNNGTMFILEDNGVKAECVVLDVGDGVLKIKNIADKLDITEFNVKSRLYRIRKKIKKELEKGGYSHEG